MEKTRRICINFMDRCNMSCNYCYIPFINEKINFSLMKKIIYKCSEIGIQIITFGGGDPYNYIEFRNIIDIAYSIFKWTWIFSESIYQGGNMIQTIKNSTYGF